MSAFGAALVGHLIGDLLLQNRWLRERKARWWATGLHVVVAGGLPAALAGWWDWRFCASIGAHLLIDRPKLARRWARWFGQPETRLSWDLDDQVMHVTTLWLLSRATAVWW